MKPETEEEKNQWAKFFKMSRASYDRWQKAQQKAIDKMTPKQKEDAAERARQRQASYDHD